MPPGASPPTPATGNAQAIPQLAVFLSPFRYSFSPQLTSAFLSLPFSQKKAQTGKQRRYDLIMYHYHHVRLRPVHGRVRFWTGLQASARRFQLELFSSFLISTVAIGTRTSTLVLDIHTSLQMFRVCNEKKSSYFTALPEIL